MKEAIGFRFRDLGDPAEAALARHDELRRREESRRLLYVAMTRAKERLILSGSSKIPSETFLGMLDAAGAREVVTVEEREVTGAAPPPRRGERTKKEPLRDWAAFDAAWRSREERKEPPRFTSVTRLEEKVAVAPGGVSRGAEIGVACHEALEALDFRKPVLPAMDPAAREILEEFLKSPAFAELASAEILARELPFLLPHGEQILEGFIDVVYRSAGRVWVGDYKTDVRVKPEGYALAKEVYSRAVRDALGLEVAGFKLFYLRHGKVVEL
jgi:ATP-dependent helicase/nuclease subunit A